jgi:hypothetical protein
VNSGHSIFDPDQRTWIGSLYPSVGTHKTSRCARYACCVKQEDRSAAYLTPLADGRPMLARIRLSRRVRSGWRRIPCRQQKRDLPNELYLHPTCLSEHHMGAELPVSLGDLQLDRVGPPRRWLAPMPAVYAGDATTAPSAVRALNLKKKDGMHAKISKNNPMQSRLLR